MAIRYNIYKNRHCTFSTTTWPNKEVCICMCIHVFIFMQHYVVKLEFKRIKNEIINMYQVILHLRFFSIFLSQCENICIYNAGTSYFHRKGLLNLHELTETFSLHLFSLPEILYLLSKLFPSLICLL